MKYDKEVSRRSFLAFLGSGAAALAVSATGLDPLIGTAEAAAAKLGMPSALPFPALQITSANQLTVANGYQADWLTSSSASGGRYIGFWPGQTDNEGTLWVAHEGDDASSQARGASIYNITRIDSKSKWSVSETRHISSQARIAFTGPAKGSKALHNAKVTQGLWSNGSGGRTPWGTVFAGEQPLDSSASKAGVDPLSVGWMIEADPTDAGFAARKHTALGRFAHGDATAVLTRDRKIAVYLGSDRALFKFISAGKYDPLLGKANSALLEEGQLYAADFGSGRWLELTVKSVRAKLSNPAFRMPNGVDLLREDLLKMLQSEADVLAYAQETALVIGATPLDRPIGLAIHPADGTLFIAQSGNADSGNSFGSILRLVESGHDASADVFESDLTLAGGRQAGFSSPDGAAFDSAGRLWLASRIPSERLNSGAYAAFGNNGLYALTASGESFAKSDPFAIAPVKGALSAPAFGPEGTLFAAIAGSGVVAIRKV
ncbi:MAG: PhoX family phosphatase [Candidatus Pristimantibacillus sp.]